jgi:ribosome biogenesis protein ENP2
MSVDIQRIIKQIAERKSSSNKNNKKRPRNSNNNEPQSLGVLKEAEPSIVSQNFGVRAYDFESRRSLQEILAKSKLKSRFNQEAKNYTQLIDDLEFPTATTCIRLTADENHLFASGVYPPQIRCYVLDEMTMKFKRNCDAEVIKLLPLTSDYRKLALLQHDRHVEVHAQFGTYYKFRIPKHGRDMAYHNQSAEMFIGGTGNEIFRFNLEQGMFRQPIVAYSDNCTAINSIRVNSVHQLIGIGCENGYVECIDPRSKSVAGVLNVCSNIRDHMNTTGTEVTCFEFDSNGVTFGVGTNKGQVGLFDLRKAGVLVTKDHNYEEPIVAMGFHDLTKNVFSADKRVVKIWNKDSGDLFTNLEQKQPITDAIMIPSSGMLMIGGDKPKIKPLYIPALGPAPKWCSFVDTVTEELEEVKKFSVYQDYKLVTMEELQELGLQDLLGTDVLRPHMHGFLIKTALYKKAMEFYQKTNISIPEKTDEDIEKENENAIRQNRVDKLLNYLQKDDEEESSGKKKKKKKKSTANKTEEHKIQAVGDDRFSALFQDPEFEKDEAEEERAKKRQKRNDKKNKKQNKTESEEDSVDSGLNVYSLQMGQNISYRDSDQMVKSSDIVKQKKKPLAERVAEAERNQQNISVDTIRGSKQMVIENAKKSYSDNNEDLEEEEEKPKRRTVPKQFMKPDKKAFKSRRK